MFYTREEIPGQGVNGRQWNDVKPSVSVSGYALSADRRHQPKLRSSTTSMLQQPSTSTSPDVGSPEKIPLFQSSTQYKNWRFPPEQLQATRAALNQAAIAAIRNTFESDSVCRCRV
jgi:hypothetical protein